VTTEPEREVLAKSNPELAHDFYERSGMAMSDGADQATADREAYRLLFGWLAEDL